MSVTGIQKQHSKNEFPLSVVYIFVCKKAINYKLFLQNFTVLIEIYAGVFNFQTNCDQKVDYY